MAKRNEWKLAYEKLVLDIFKMRLKLVAHGNFEAASMMQELSEVLEAYKPKPRRSMRKGKR